MAKLTVVHLIVLSVHLCSVQGDEYFEVVRVPVGTVELWSPKAGSHFMASSWYDATCPCVTRG